MDWGIKVLECYKQQAAASKATGGVGAAPDNQSQESYEFAITTLEGAFRAMHTQFSQYMQLDGASKAPFASDGLKDLAATILPAPISSLAAQFNSSAAYTGDSLLQARALLADVIWVAREASVFGDSEGEAAAAYEAVMAYTAEHMRRLLRWLFSEQFGGPKAYAPTAPPPTDQGIAAARALSALAAVALPPAGAALDDPRWLQARALSAYALQAAALDAAALPTGAAANASLGVYAVMTAIGGAHVADFWGVRVEAARSAADAAMRSLALDDRGGSRGWKALALGLASALQGVRYQVAILTNGESTPPESPVSQMRDGMAQLLAGVALDVNSDLPDSAPSDAVAAFSRAASLAGATLACYGSGASAAGAAHATACTDLGAATADIVKAALGDLGAGDILYAAASDGVALQWRCAARPADSCAALPGCARAVLPAAPVVASYPSVAALPAVIDVPSCQVDDARLDLRRASNATKAALAAPGGSCVAFLQLPVCEAVTGGAAACGAYAACRWQTRSARYYIQSADAASQAAADGVCGTDWSVVLQGVSGAQLRSSLASASSTCAAQKISDGCNALMVRVAAASPSGSHASPLSSKVVGAAVGVAAGVAVLLLFAAFMYLRRRASARAAEAEGSLGGTGSGPSGASSLSRKRKGSKKRVWKRKIKRAEPGEYKPDLMRDSFTDYLHRPAFRAGVAIAQANMAAGAQDFENPLAGLQDEVGNHHRLLLEPTSGFVRGARQLPEGEEAASASTSADGQRPLINFSSGEVEEDELTSRRDQQRQEGGQAQGQGQQMQVEEQQEYQEQEQGLQPRFSYNPFLARGEGDLHAYQPSGDLAASAALGAARASFGASASLARASLQSSVAASVASGHGLRVGVARRAAGVVAGRAGAVPMAPASAYGGTDDGESSQLGTPTSSCCHDSVCTFRVAPGSVAGSVQGAAPARRAEAQPALESAREVEGEERQEGAALAGNLSLSRASWASQDLLVSVPSSAPVGQE